MSSSFFTLQTHHFLTVQFRRLLLVKKRSVAFCVNLPSTHDCIIKYIHSTSYIYVYMHVYGPIYSNHPRPTRGCLVGMTVLSKTLASLGRFATMATYFPISSASTKPSSFPRRAASSSDIIALRTFPGLI